MKQLDRKGSVYGWELALINVFGLWDGIREFGFKCCRCMVIVQRRVCS